MDRRFSTHQCVYGYCDGDLCGPRHRLGIVIDFAAAAVSARRVGASRQGIIGAAIGTLAGIFSGLWGLLFMPLAGAAVGEFIAHKDMFRAGKIGAATWFGLLLATAVKLAIAFTMVGAFIASLLI